VYTIAESPNDFQWAGQLPKIAPSHLIHGSLGLHESAPQTASRFCTVYQRDQHRHILRHTDRHTDHATCDICGNRLHLMHYVHAMWP